MNDFLLQRSVDWKKECRHRITDQRVILNSVPNFCPTLCLWGSDSCISTVSFPASTVAFSSSGIATSHLKTYDTPYYLQALVCRLLQYILPFSLRFSCTAWLIYQSLRFQAQVKLASLGWCHKTGECANSCARRSVCFWSQSIGGASIGLFM